MTHNGHKTAIARKRPSAPMLALSRKGLLVGKMLDYGCGRGFDAVAFGMDGYDPHYRPNLPDRKYDTITCNFVLNVIPDATEREFVISVIRSMLAPGGTAYVTVRTDKSSLNGWTKAGTWQGLIELDAPIVQRGAGFVTYKICGDN